MSSIRSGPQPYRQSPGAESNKSSSVVSKSSSSTTSSSPSSEEKENHHQREEKEKQSGTSSSSKNLEGFILKRKINEVVRKMSGSGGSSGTNVTSQPQNLASASATAASSLLYSAGVGSSSTRESSSSVTSSGGGSSSLLRGYTSGLDKTRWDDSNRQKSSSLTGRYNNTSSTSSSSATNTTSSSTTGSNLNNTMSHHTTTTTTNGTGNVPNGNLSHANGSSLTGTGALSSGSYSINAGNYRLASLDRLAQRQKLYDHQNGGAGDASKRELFFKNESSPAPALVTTIKTEAGNAPPSSNYSMGGGGNLPITKPDLPPPVSVKIDTHRSHHTNNMEDNREKESKEKLKEKDKRRKELDGYVGFANLPNQVYRKAVKRGFDFTLMVVGESGLGKSTLINSMFLADIYSAEHPGPSHRIKKTVQVETCKVLLKENGVNLTLTIVDTPGFGDAVDNSNCWQPVMDYIENRYEDYLNAESRVNRKQITDNRVHCCLYFIAPSGHGLKPLDIELMKKLHDKVNIIPVLAKSDTMTPDEISAFKNTVLNEITQHKIKIYEFPDCDDEEENKVNKMMRDRVPFAVVGSNTVIEVDGKKLRGRKYPWGTVIVENMEHCDFVPLRNMVVRTHLQDLKEVTNNVHYENFRCRKLAGPLPDGKPMGNKFGDKNPLAQMEDERKNHEHKMKKMETEMEQVFELKVKERNQRIIDSENDLTRREEQMKKSLEKLQKEVEDKKKMYETEKYTWEQVNGITFEELRRRSLEALSKEACKGSKDHQPTLKILCETGISLEDPTAQANGDSKDSKNRVKRSKSMPKQHRTSFRGQHECTQS